MPADVRVMCPFCLHIERTPVVMPYLQTFDVKGNRVQSASQAKIGLSAACCYACSRSFGVRFEGDGGTALNSLMAASGQGNAAIDAALNSVRISTFPEPLGIAPSSTLPEKIRRPFQEIQEDVARKRNAPGVMAISRGCLDVALKLLKEENGGRVDRINNLRDKGLLTASLAEWAQKLWKDGSDAVHDLEATNESAAEHVEFLKLFFQVVFELPAQVVKAQTPSDLGDLPSTEPAAT